MMFESIPDKIVCYRGVRIQCPKTSAADHAGGQFCAPLKQYHMKLRLPYN